MLGPHFHNHLNHILKQLLLSLQNTAANTSMDFHPLDLLLSNLKLPWHTLYLCPVLCVSVPAVPPQQSHRCDYELVPNHGYYKLHTLAKSWDEARRICLSEGSHLLVLNSAEELIAVKSIWDRNPDFNDTQHKDYIHVGLRKNKENTFLLQEQHRLYWTHVDKT